MLMDKEPLVKMTLQQRRCECCGSNDLELVWSNQSVVRRATSTWLFPVRVVICRQCGFSFTSPSPAIADLGRYHADGLSGYEGIGLPYSIDVRVSMLARYSAPSGVFAEIGGNRPDEFHNHLAGLFGKILNIEVTEDAPADYRSVAELPTESVDVLTHYDVLEHIPNVKYFLFECHRALKENGVMLCEVPDIRLYPRNLLLLEFEHVNHFSVTSLAMIAQACGLQLIELGHICSRPYGFVAVFGKNRPGHDHVSSMPFEYMDALACVQGGVAQVQRVLSHIKSIQGKITALAAHGEKITLWGVTDLLRRLLENYRLPDTAIVVDSDPRRKRHLEGEGVPVFLPNDCRDHIVQSNLLAIFAPRYKTEILEWVKQEKSSIFDMIDVEVIGSGPTGETLI